MKLFILSCLTIFTFVAFGQKPPLDISTFNNWEEVGNGIINPNATYVCYNISNQCSPGPSLIVQSIKDGWKKEFKNSSTASFTNDNERVVFRVGLDSLCLLTLGKEDVIFIPHVATYEVPSNGNGIWLAYKLTGPENNLVLLNLITGTRQQFSSVISYLFSADANHLLIEQYARKGDSSESTLHLMSLPGGGLKDIWSSLELYEKVANYVFDATGDQVAFLVEKRRNNKIEYDIRYYKTGIDTAILIANDQTPGIEEGFTLANRRLKFSKDGRQIFLGLHLIKKETHKPDSVKVDVWSYTDTKLQSLQLNELSYDAPIFTAIINIGENRIIRIEKDDEQIYGLSDDCALILHELGNEAIFESNWNLAAQVSFYLVSTKTGSRKLIKNHITNPNSGLGLSPQGRWIIYYDFRRKNYFSYEIRTGVIRNITEGCSTIWVKDNDKPEPSLPWGPWIKSWLANDEAVLINDNYDIWQVDPTGMKTPINLTNGYGRKYHIKFELLNQQNMLDNFFYEKKSTLILKAFNNENKNMGFYSKVITVKGDPKLCTIGPYVYGEWYGYGSSNHPPLKARDTFAFLVLRMSAEESPNYFVTTDFKNFIALSHVQPQKHYNWMTTELIHWKTFDGRSSTGILYKPENFDYTKKYPIIFEYYEKRSDELNLYIRPAAAEGRINIPWFVSNGYLVCTPDIHYKIGEPGQGAYDAVVSCANYLGRLPWVDAKRMGIQGHSFGGYETNYLVTHTNIFAAACSASGACDLISKYGSAARGGYSMYQAERNQSRMGATPWQIPYLYIKNSPIFKADNVTTPLLMMNNKNDDVVPFAQGVEFFTALRRLGKKVWMLQYDGAGHSLEEEKAVDYTIRISQFFDHYLKGYMAPKWMTRGVPAYLKGINDGFQLDNELKTPGPGLNLREPCIY